MSCKVSDFGLSRATEADGEAKTCVKDVVAIRWAAPEAMAERTYTSQSDVWSFGILLHEVFSYGTKPYDGWTNKRVRDELRAGYRLPKPPLASDQIYEIMMATWHADPAERPEFYELESRLRVLMEQLEALEGLSPTAQSTSRLVDRFNAKKKELMSSSSGDDAPSPTLSKNGKRSSGKRDSADPGDESRARAATVNSRLDASRATPFRSRSPTKAKVFRYDRGSTPPASPKSPGRLFGLGSAEKRAPNLRLTRATWKAASYIAVLGEDGKVIHPQDTIDTAPPVYAGLIDQAVEKIDAAPGTRLAVNIQQSTREFSVQVRSLQDGNEGL